MATYLPYPKYKSSGNSWLGEIPEHWTPRRSDFVVDTNRQQVSAESLNGHEVIHYSIPNVQEYGAGVVEGGDKVDSAKLLINEEQLLVSKLNPRKAALCIAKPDDAYMVIASSEFVPILPAKANLRYAYYLWGSDKVTKLLSSMVQSVTRSHQRVNPSDILKLHWAWPTQEEQQAIAHFLDFKTAQIDSLIAKKRELLDKLGEKRTALISHAVTKGLDPSVPMKDSGVAWLGKIPAHWEAKRTKFSVSYIGSGKTPKGGSEVYVQEGIMILRSQNVHDKRLRLDDVAYITDEADSAQAASRVLAGDVLLNITGASIGRTSIVPTPFPQANVNQHVCILRPIRNLVTPEYLHLLLCSRQAKDQISSLENGTSREGLNFTQVGGLLFAFPPVQEQVAIVLTLAAKVEAIDRQSEKVLSVTERLVEYRSAVITNAVTGKIDVRGFRVPQTAEEAAS